MPPVITLLFKAKVDVQILQSLSKLPVLKFEDKNEEVMVKYKPVQ